MSGDPRALEEVDVRSATGRAARWLYRERCQAKFWSQVIFSRPAIEKRREVLQRVANRPEGRIPKKQKGNRHYNSSQAGPFRQSAGTRSTVIGREDVIRTFGLRTSILPVGLAGTQIGVATGQVREVVNQPHESAYGIELVRTSEPNSHLQPQLTLARYPHPSL